MRLLLILPLVLALAACGGSAGEKLLDDYVWRLGNVSGSDAEAPALTEAPTWPRARERRLEVPEVRGRFLEVFTLNECDLTRLLAERNSILGRHYSPVALLVHDTRVIERLNACHQRLAEIEQPSEREAGFLGRIEALHEAKTESFSAVAWNASFGEESFASLFSLSSPMLAPEEEGRFVTAAAALDKLIEAQRRLDQGQVIEDLAELDLAHRELGRSGFGGSWIRAVRQQIHSLQTGSARLDAIDTDRFCPNGRPGTQARTLDTVFWKFYAGRVQPYLAQTHQQMRDIAPALERLWSAQQVTPPPSVAEFRQATWVDSERSLRGQLDAAILAHAKAWQRVLGDCSLTPDAARPQS
jgi:hypothetical protein